MTAIAGTSLLYSISNLLLQSGPVSYYQYKALESFLDILVLHDELHLFVGNEPDQNYLDRLQGLIRDIHENTDFKITLITSKEYIEPDIVAAFEGICERIYGCELGITPTQLFTKKPKVARIEDDLAQIVTEVNSIGFDANDFARKIYETYSRNSNTATFLYLFRGHFFQAVAEIHHFTPMFVNHRLVAEILHQSVPGVAQTGTLAFLIYRMVNRLFLDFSQSLSGGKETYPSVSILMTELISTSNARNGFLKTIYEMRNNYSSFRKEYKGIEKTLNDRNEALISRSEAKRKFDVYVQKIWLPTMNSLSVNRKIVRNQVKKSLGKFGLGGVELETTFKDTGGNGYSTENDAKTNINLTGIAAELLSLTARISKEAYLWLPNKPLFESISKIIQTPDLEKKLTTLLPITNYLNTRFQELDRIISRLEKEVP